ncbi:sulfotransferase [Tropicimonas isoalkanivorans]|uniref:Sulfotransferase family protein n=1 Tax=Tropicimonas isoalkanivorans TaxID=441112 RepID=A0A1I1NDI7_9RHOB|nr:sulfotransferase [Tropicimonas isoalkanivorans]SFC95741.1 Sulfotransferase family protein [Tropicimonas isoalkanivorans]
MKHVFIVAYGRTGSTALMKALNCIEGACIRGENGGLIQPLALSLDLAQASKRRHVQDSQDVSRPWFGAEFMRPKRLGEGLARVFTRTILAPPEGTRITGFKEIRYASDLLTEEAFEAILRFMLTCFENPHVIFLTRDAEQVAESAWWQDRDRDVVLDVLDHTVHRFRMAHEDHPKRTFLIDHATFDGNPEGLRPLLDWLGEDAPPEALAEALSERIVKPEEAEAPAVRETA